MQMTKPQTQIEQFIKLFTQGLEAWVEAGKLVAAALEQDPEWAEKVHAAHPEISEDVIYAFDRIGRRELHPKLMLSDSPGAKKLRKLPFSIQQKHADAPVPVLIKSGGKIETLEVSVFNLTSDQANQVFDESGVRPVAAQRAWIEDRASKAMVIVDEPYRVVGRTLVVMNPCKLTAKQIAGLLAQMQ
jgi:hypothetical protein